MTDQKKNKITLLVCSDITPIKMENKIIIIGDYPNGNWEKTEYDSNNNEIYWESSDGYWIKSEYDSNGNKIYLEDSDGYWIKSEYDSNGNEIYWENSDGYWEKYEYDSNGNEIYYEDSDGYWFKYNSNGDEIDKGIKDIFPTPEEIKQYIENGK